MMDGWGGSWKSADVVGAIFGFWGLEKGGGEVGRKQRRTRANVC